MPTTAAVCADFAGELVVAEEVLDVAETFEEMDRHLWAQHDHFSSDGSERSGRLLRPDGVDHDGVVDEVGLIHDTVGGTTLNVRARRSASSTRPSVTSTRARVRSAEKR